MNDIYGTLLDVHTDTVGSPVVADTAVAATVLTVVDASPFSETGGLLRVNGDVYTYLTADPELDTVTLASGLVRAILADDLVEAYPTTQVKTAFVDLGIKGDSEGVWALVPQSMVLTLADGLRPEGQQETILLEERAVGELILKDVKAASNIASTTVIPEGSVDTHQIEVGVTGNLVQDPDFLRNLWQPPRKFSIVGPDTVYTDSNFVRVTGTTEANSVHDGGGTSDWDWWLCELVPVDPGRTVRIVVQVRRDAASIGGSPPSPPEARVRILFYKSDRITMVSDATMMEALVLADDTVADTWTTLEATSEVPEGYTHFRAGIQVSYQVAGTVDFIKPEIQVLWNRVQSANYVEGQTGWNFDTEAAQVENLNVLDTVGAGVVSAGQLLVSGDDILDTVAGVPVGLIGLGSIQSGTSTAWIGSTETILFRGAISGVKGPAMYMIIMQYHIRADTDGAVADVFMRYTVGDTGPSSAPTVTTANGIMMMETVEFKTQQGRGRNLIHFYTPATDHDQLKFAISLKVTIGATAKAQIAQEWTNRPLEVAWIDIGPDTARGNGVLAQVSKEVGTADPDPPTTYTKSWYATWSRSYDSDLGTRTGDDTTDCYQGYYSSTHGNTRSLFGFDYADIMSKLSGATVNKVTLTFRVHHSWSPSAGITVYLASHNYTAKPATWASGSVTQNRFNWGGQKEGSTYTHDITSLGNEFKAGTTKGLGFGPAPSNSSTAYYGYMYGGTTSASRPKITITYTK